MLLDPRWHNANDHIPRDINADLPRFGHSAVNFNGSMIVHGGFHGKRRGKSFFFLLESVYKTNSD